MAGTAAGEVLPRQWESPTPLPESPRVWQPGRDAKEELDTQRDGDLHARRRCVPVSSGNSRCSIVDGVEDARRGQLHPPRARPWREAGLRVAHHLACFFDIVHGRLEFLGSGVDHRADGLDEMRTPWVAAWAARFCRPRLEKAERTGRGGVMRRGSGDGRRRRWERTGRRCRGEDEANRLQLDLSGIRFLLARIALRRDAFTESNVISGHRNQMPLQIIQLNRTSVGGPFALKTCCDKLVIYIIDCSYILLLKGSVHFEVTQ
ncbi:unnamed protein product [Miscanthus lutarioriparius]|uniref:Uncharacterized protein n=1 Tax=Miscanthus lutarioriparius TaxID=422564 RepID=A0A811NMT5_9POAL|nr:unnamed protein product [Miscanthus lutarioriparius]